MRRRSSEKSWTGTSRGRTVWFGASASVLGVLLLGDFLTPSRAISQEGPPSEMNPDDEVQDGLQDGEGATVATEETWDSYAEATVINSAAQDVTMGVRVEDIVEPPTDYQFAAFGKGDPFVPPLYLKEDIASAVDPIEIPIISPLQRHPIANLVVAGIWENADGTRKALILVPDAASPVGIVSRKDDPIGINGGRILAINKESVTVREFRLAPDGTRQYDDKQLTLDRTGMPEAPQVGGSILIRPGAAQGEVIGVNGKPLALTTDDPGANGPAGGTSRQSAGVPQAPGQPATAGEAANLQAPAAADAAIPVAANATAASAAGSAPAAATSAGAAPQAQGAAVSGTPVATPAAAPTVSPTGISVQSSGGKSPGVQTIQ